MSAPPNRTEKWTEAQYRTTPIDQTTLKTWSQATPTIDFPPPNPLIPTIQQAPSEEQPPFSWPQPQEILNELILKCSRTLDSSFSVLTVMEMSTV